MKKTLFFYTIFIIVITAIYANYLVKDEYGINLKDYIIYSLPYTNTESEWIKERPTILYAADQSSPPLRYVDQNDQQYKGVVIDYLSSLSIQLSKEIRFVPYRWEEAIEKLKKNETDLADMFISESRENELVFSIPIYKLRGSIAHTQKIVKISNKKDLIGLRIAIPRGDYALDYLKDIESRIEIVSSEDILDALTKVSSGEADVAIGDEPVINYYLKEKGNLPNLVQSSWVMYENNVVLGTAKKNKQLLKVVNKAILKLQKKQEVDKIRTKWMGMASPMKLKTGLNSTSFKFFILAELIALIALIFIIGYRLLAKEVESKTKKLSETNEDLEHIFESIPEMKVIIDQNYQIIKINDFFADFIELEKKELLGKLICEVDSLNFFHQIKGMFEYVLETGNKQESEIRFDDQIFIVSCFPMHQNWPQEKKLIISMKDITFQKFNEQQLLQINKMAAVGELAGGIAHEVKNPLGLIRSYTYLLKDDSIIPQENQLAYDYLSGIEKSTERAKEIIDNLLNFSKLTNDDEREFNLSELIKELLKLEEKRLVNQKINCEIINKGDFMILSKKESMKHILINLISNAIDAMPRGGELTINCRRHEEVIELSIIDTGIGIPPDILSSVFNPFFTTKLSENGTGLGLYIVYEQVQRLGGYITVNSFVDKGTTFIIKF